MTPEEIRLLFDYNSWANHHSLEAASALSAEAYAKPLGSSFSSVGETLAHIYGAEVVWLGRFLGESPKMPDLAQVATLSALRKRWDEVEAKLARFVAGLAQADLDREIHYRNLAGEPYRNSLWQPLQHLVNHGTYHRGQVTTMLRQLGAKPVSTDLIRFYRERAAASGA